ncbi:MAG: hypothetical protein Q8O56_10780 [Solirubrobacteraceae bacterium]|nr:hypothetical protein [Solirubrobacteraceae bacterium]
MHPARRRTALIALLGAFALTLSACGGGEDDASTATSAGGATTTAPAPGGLVVGIGEQNSPMFADRRFRALGLRHARLVAPYDVTSVRSDRDLVDLWLHSARSAGVEPFITFGHSYRDPDKLPSTTEFRRAFRAFRARHPDVRVYAPWNEINHASQPTATAPRQAAEYYNVVRAECADCVVLAGDVLDQAGMTRYIEQYRRHLDGEPAIWGLHNYADTNRFRSTGLRDLLDAVSGEVWLTETGGIVRFGRNFPYDEQRAARAIDQTFKLALASERVTRIYLYNWTGAQPDGRFDAGLTGPDGSTRPGLVRLRAALRR